MSDWCCSALRSVSASWRSFSSGACRRERWRSANERRERSCLAPALYPTQDNRAPRGRRYVPVRGRDDLLSRDDPGICPLSRRCGCELEFLTSLPLPPGENGGGILNALIGSAMVVLCAAAMAVPIGLGAAVFVNEFPTAGFGRFVRFLAEVLTGVPSIVVGLFAYALVVRPLGGFSGFSGSVAYAFIMIPIILISAHEAFRLVPDSLREASLALGIPKWRTILRVVLPVSSRALLTGVGLSVPRGRGEAAPMLFPAFGNPFWNLNWGKPVATVPLLIYTYAT